MRIYVAGSGEELGRARRVMAALRAAGHTITHDWTVGYAADADMDDVHAATSAERDIDGIDDSEAFLLLRNPARTTFGAAFEAGFADALTCNIPGGKPIDAGGILQRRRLMLVGARGPIFLRSWEHYETDEQAVAALGDAPLGLQPTRTELLEFLDGPGDMVAREELRTAILAAWDAVHGGRR